MKNTIEQEIQRVLANLDAQHEQKQGPGAETPEEKEPETPTPGQDETQEIQDIYVLVVRERDRTRRTAGRHSRGNPNTKERQFKKTA